MLRSIVKYFKLVFQYFLWEVFWIILNGLLVVVISKFNAFNKKSPKKGIYILKIKVYSLLQIHKI
jgi:hypothetical protein